MLYLSRVISLNVWPLKKEINSYFIQINKLYLKWRAAILLRISGGMSICTRSCKSLVALWYADKDPWRSLPSKIWASSIQASTSSLYCSVTCYKTHPMIKSFLIFHSCDATLFISCSEGIWQNVRSYLFEMLLGQISLTLWCWAGIKGTKDLHGFIVAWLGF